MHTTKKLLALSIALVFCSTAASRAEDWPMWGRTPQRLLNSPEKNPPTSWDVETGENVKWAAKLGSQSHSSPIIAGGLVFVGTNNEAKLDPKHTEDGGVLMIFRESDGAFLWQRFSAKLKAGRVNDWPYQGVCATVYAEGDYIWYCTNRCEVVCLDVSPLRKGTGEPKEVWVLDMMAQLGVFPHNMTACSITSWGDLIYVITANGVDDTHKNIPAPKAPAIVCLDKKSGKVAWSDNTPGENIMHGQWASPSIATVNGRTLVIAPLGDSWLYAFEAQTGKKVWWFDTNLKDTVYPMNKNELIATPAVDGNRLYLATGQDPEHGEGPGHLWCIDITKEGDVSLELPVETQQPKAGEELMGNTGAASRKGKPNPNSAVIWHFQKYDPDGKGKVKTRDRMNRSISTVALANGLVFAPDFSGYLHCFDAQTGQRYWVHNMEAAMWGSPLVIDGKVYLADEEGDVAIFEAARNLKVLGTYHMGSACYGTPAYANGALYLMTRERIFAIADRKLADKKLVEKKP